MGHVKTKGKKIVTGIVLVCICLITGGVFYYLYVYPERPLGMEGDAHQYQLDKMREFYRKTEIAWVDILVTFTVDGKTYTNIFARDRVKYGLLEESFVEEGLKPVYPSQNYNPDWYKHLFTRGDIGEYIGKVEESDHAFLVGLKVYHYSAYPDSDEICILKLGGKYGYEFYRLLDIGNGAGAD